MKIQAITTLENGNLHVQFDTGEGLQYITSGDFFQTPMVSGDFTQLFLVQWAASRLNMGDEFSDLVDREVTVDFASPAPVVIAPAVVLPGSAAVSGSRIGSVWKALFPRK